MKKAAQAAQIGMKVKEVEFKLKTFEQDKLKLQKLVSELDALKPQDFVDFTKNDVYVKKTRELKHLINDHELRLKEIEEVNKEVVRSLAEQDMENSVDLLQIKAQTLGEQLAEAKKHLTLISTSGEEMDGNISNPEEEEFIEALKNEMPDVFDNIENTELLLNEIEKLVQEVKKTLDVDIMTDL